MRKIINSFLNIIKDDYLEKISLGILILWVISPLIEYIFKNYYENFYTFYYGFMVYFIGFFGIITYFIYFIRLKSRKKINIKNFIPEILIIILLVISIISTILSENFSLSLFGEFYRKEGLIVYVMYIGILLLASIIKDSKYINYLFKCMIIVCLIVGIIPLFKSDFTYIGFPNAFHQFNHYGYYLMVNVMLSAFMFLSSDKWTKKIIYILIYIFLIYLLIRNDTFGSYLAVSIILIFLFIYSLIKKYRRANIILIVLVFVITSFAVSHFDIKIGERVNFESTQGLVGKNFLTFTKDIKNIISKDNSKGLNKAGTGRGLLWKEAFNYTLDHPFFGGGMECLQSYYFIHNINYNDRPHNIILQTSSFIGIPGAIIYLFLIMYIAIANLKIMKNNTIHIMVFSTAMCYFISSLFGNSMYYTSPYYMILLGILIGFNRYQKYKLD